MGGGEADGPRRVTGRRHACHRVRKSPRSSADMHIYNIYNCMGPIDILILHDRYSQRYDRRVFFSVFVSVVPRSQCPQCTQTTGRTATSPSSAPVDRARLRVDRRARCRAQRWRRAGAPAAAMARGRGSGSTGRAPMPARWTPRIARGARARARRRASMFRAVRAVLAVLASSSPTYNF